jgi:nucleoside-diphosphate-sugar epimerase
LNVRSHLGLLELIREVRPEAVVVHTSTRQVYGRPRYLPVDEDHPTAPVDVNGVDKLAAEQLHLLYATVHDIAVSALRLTNVYGPRQSLVRDGLGFLPVFVRRALQGQPIDVFGDGHQLRDCLYVDDVVRALVLAAITPDSVGQVFNLGHDEALDLADIAHTITGAAGGASEVALAPWPDDLVRIDIGSFWGDFSKAKRVLGWEPAVGFAAGIATTIAFYREHPWYLSST